MHKAAIADKGLDSAAALPAAVWPEILQHVPQQQRLTQCALVGTVWAAAAASATVHLVVQLQRPDGDAKPSLPSLQRWLARHTGHLLTIKVCAESSCFENMRLLLPLDQLTQLQHLQLQGFKLQLPNEEDSSAEGSSHAAMVVLSSLQHLELKNVGLASVSSLLQLTNAPQLTSLLLNGIKWGSEAAEDELADAMPGLLQQLPQLSVLKLPWWPLSDAAMQQMGALQGLQSISLIPRKQPPLCNLQLLPSSITRMELLGASTWPTELPQLSWLLQLELESCEVPPSVLSGLTQLRVLHMMEYCKLLPAVGDHEDNPQGTAALLDALLQLTQLQDLKLQLWTVDINSIAPERFAALTASSHLTQLFLTRDHKQNIPKGAIHHMFPVGRQMPFLQRLGINVEASDDDGWCLRSVDLGRISKCCPQLHWLDICGSVNPRADLSMLLQLPESCTSLLVGGAAFDDAAASVLVQLTQLKHLSWSWATEFTDKGLEQLVALDLDSFFPLYCGLSEEVRSEEEDRVLQSDPVLGSVSQQLDAMCDLSPVLAAVRFPKFRKQAEADRRVLQQLCLEMDSLRAQLAHSQAEHERGKLAAALENQQLQQEVSSLREQLAGSQVEVLQLKQQLSAQQQCVRQP